MSLNSLITLGRSGPRVSPFCLGTMTFGEDLGWGGSVRDSETMIATYLERGGNFIDTANVYTNGHSEKIIGHFFAKKGSRDRVRRIISSSTNSAPWRRRLAQHPPPSRWHGYGAAQASNRR